MGTLEKMSNYPYIMSITVIYIWSGQDIMFGP